MLVERRSQQKSPYDLKRPLYRRLRIFASDPSLAQSLETSHINEITVDIPWEPDPDNLDLDGPAPGPVGEYLEIIDRDPETGVFYRPVDLNNKYILASDGLAPSEGNPQFHQQMIYAVAMRTVQLFEKALGRRIFWAQRRYDPYTDLSDMDRYVGRLRIYPHALREANAYYSPARVALMFGYFKREDYQDDLNLPGGMVFTCLSHDIIAHETAHALLDGINRNLLVPTNVDTLAFHEAFADIVALFQHFTMPDVLEHQIAKSNGRLNESGSLLGDLAREFGHAIGRGSALRSSAGTVPDPSRIQTTTQPHARGALLVSAVFDAFHAIYEARSKDLWRIAEAYGTADGRHLPPDLVRRLAKEAAKSADHVVTMCIRALDYLPPVDIDFGDYLRAIITADMEVMPYDPKRYRIAFMEAFRKWGVFPANVRSFSEDGLRWDPVDIAVTHDGADLFLTKALNADVVKWDLRSNRRETFKTLVGLKKSVQTYIEANTDKMSALIQGIDLDKTFYVESVKPSRRTGRDGHVMLDAVVEISQKRPGYFVLDGEDDAPDHDKAQAMWDRLEELRETWRRVQGKTDEIWPEWRARQPNWQEPDFWFRGGSTLIVDLGSGQLRYCIFNNVKSQSRYERYLDFLVGEYDDPSLRGLYMSGDFDDAEVFAVVHRAEGAAS